jgi:hypothetical protein
MYTGFRNVVCVVPILNMEKLSFSDPDSGSGSRLFLCTTRIQIHIQVFEKIGIINYKKNAIFLSLFLQIGRSSYRRRLQHPREHPTLQNRKKFLKEEVLF